MAYNVTALDRSGAHATVFIGPDRDPVVTRRAVITNHQGTVDWPEHAEATGSVDRLRVLSTHLEDESETEERFIGRFLEPPTYSHQHDRGFGTLYTAVYVPSARRATFLWPGYRWEQSMDAFKPGSVEVHIEEPVSF
jgi:predicted choloylglycine hydrolase